VVTTTTITTTTSHPPPILFSERFLESVVVVAVIPKRRDGRLPWRPLMEAAVGVTKRRDERRPWKRNRKSPNEPPYRPCRLMLPLAVVAVLVRRAVEDVEAVAKTTRPFPGVPVASNEVTAKTTRSCREVPVANIEVTARTRPFRGAFNPSCLPSARMWPVLL